MYAKQLGIILLTLVLSIGLKAQRAPENWFHLDMETDGYPGVRSEQLYQKLNNRKGQPVIVAVIDSGVDVEHEDLDEVLWINKDEIPGNGRDDDNNGYIDDIHGWNFIGNPNGENVSFDTYEVTRTYRKYKEQFEGKDREDIKKKNRETYDRWKDAKETVEKKQKQLAPQVEVYRPVYNAIIQLREAIDKPSEEITIEDIEAVQTETNDPEVRRAAQVAQSILPQVNNNFAQLEKELKGAAEYFVRQYDYNYNPDFYSREIVNDDYGNPYEKGYGNNDYEGPDADHGTHVAGIVAAERNNEIGIDGIANNVRIMTVRAVPDGDERDKDVANAIIYAVDNGAKVINMSFGKGWSPRKNVVDKAVKYAAKNDVLIVHAAGNDGKENQFDNNYPNDQYLKKGLFGPKNAPNWIEVGALNWEGGENLAANFSNFSQDKVDIFAPGVDIYSTTPDNTYEFFPGTSMAAPMVAGAAAMLRSYFPDLTAEQVKAVLMESARKIDEQVRRPGEGDLVPFRTLSVSGGILDLATAFEIAAQTKGKNKKNPRYFGPGAIEYQPETKEQTVP